MIRVFAYRNSERLRTTIKFHVELSDNNLNSFGDFFSRDVGTKPVRHYQLCLIWPSEKVLYVSLIFGSQSNDVSVNLLTLQNNLIKNKKP